MKKNILLFCLLIFTVIPVKADEGMWLMMLIKRLNYTDMQKKGLKLTPEEIYQVNNSSLKDAIVSFGGYCTGEIVSDQGLLLTNHHCGYGSIAGLSTPEKDYLTNGYWAKNNKEELPIERLYVRFFVRMDDVTERINALLSPELTEEKRNDIINTEFLNIEKENSENDKYTVVVKSFFEGNEFYYFVYQDFKDIRFVGAPPSSIGKFGGDTDNWEWPRHTGDFSLFRIYADKNGNPSEYSENNIPYIPKYSLPISNKEVRPGDFTMILGYPGTTSRYLSSYGINQLITYEYPAFIEVSKKAMDIMKLYMDYDKTVELDYTGKYSSIANYWKNRIGTIEAINKNRVVIAKEKEEKEFIKWANKKNNKADYGNVLSDLEKYYKATHQSIQERMYLLGIQRSAYIGTAYSLGSMLKTYQAQDELGKEAMKPKLIESVNKIYENFHPHLEKELFQDMINLYLDRVRESNFLPVILKQKELGGDFKSLIEQSIFENKDKVIEFINNSNKNIEKDILYILALDYATELQGKTKTGLEIDLEVNYNKTQRLFIDGLKETFPNKVFYPDANSTMRMTYGAINSLKDNPEKPNDAKENYYTTFKGMIAKYKKGDAEFHLPQKLLDLYESKDYVDYANSDGELSVNFLSDNDITGGNSGSPVINGKGELIGLAFDGNWEAMSGNILFDANLQRAINVDIRFVLFIIDKYAEATHLIKEMKIIN